MQYDENKLLFWIIFNVLLLLSLINMNVYFTLKKKKNVFVLNTYEFDFI